MPPKKKPDGPSKKTEQKKKEKVIEVFLNATRHHTALLQPPSFRVPCKICRYNITLKYLLCDLFVGIFHCRAILLISEVIALYYYIYIMN